MNSPSPAPSAAPTAPKSGLRVLPLGIAAALAGPAAVGVGFLLTGSKIGWAVAGGIGVLGVLLGVVALGLGIVRFARSSHSEPVGRAVVGMLLGVAGGIGSAYGGIIGLLVGAGGGAHGRPLRRAGRPVVAPVAQHDAWSEGPVPQVDGLPDTVRASLAAAWTRDALAEHASVAAFSQLALQLMAVGAPARLVDASLVAAREEVGHAQRCFALAAAYAGHPVGPDALPAAVALPGTDPGTTLALESLLDGCIEEAAAARVAAVCALSAEDPALRATLSCLAAEEASHAALSWELVRWSLARDPAGVGAAVQKALAALPIGAATTAVAGDVFGRPSPGSFEAAQAEARAHLRAQVATLVALPHAA